MHKYISLMHMCTVTRWAKGWSRLGAAWAKTGQHKMGEAVRAYERSLHLEVRIRIVDA